MSRRVPDVVCWPRAKAVRLAEIEHTFRAYKAKNGSSSCNIHWRAAERAAGQAVEHLRAGRDRRAAAAIKRTAEAVYRGTVCEARIEARAPGKSKIRR